MSKRRKIIGGILLGILLGVVSLYRLRLYIAYPDLSLEEYRTCIASKAVKRAGLFLVTEAGVCVNYSVCKGLSDHIFCKEFRFSDPTGWRIADGLSKSNFDADELLMQQGGRGYLVIDDTNRWVKKEGESFHMLGGSDPNQAWRVEVNGITYFWWPMKGGKRLFPIDKDTFEYLGGDTYRDKDGIIRHNTRVK